MKFKVWTEAYRPFLMGGNVNAPVSTEVEVGEPFDIGQGLQGYLVVAPSGKTHVAESTTGAFVGTTVDQIKADLESADPDVVKAQMETAATRAQEAEPLDAEHFWSLFK